jgi:hypothetical protein
VSVGENALESVIAAIGDQLRPAVSDPLAFVQQTRVLPLDSTDGVRVAVIFALLPFEIDAIRRAAVCRSPDGASGSSRPRTWC